MLHAILIISTSGIVLFHKEFINGMQKSKQIGGVITAMLKFSMQKTGLPVSYIQLQNVGVSIASNADARCTCAVFHDPEDGSDFGKLLSRELLYSFTLTYSAELLQDGRRGGGGAGGPSGGGGGGGGGGTGVYSMDHYAEFQSKIAHIIRNAVKPLLDQLQEQRGIALVLLCANSSDSDPHSAAESPASALQHSTQEVDKLAVLANHQALMGVATDIMGAQNDTANSVILRSRRTTLILLRVERASLIVVFKNSVDATVCLQHIERTADLVRKVLIMASNLKT